MTASDLHPTGAREWPARRSPGACARSPAGATSSARAGPRPRCAARAHRDRVRPGRVPAGRARGSQAARWRPTACRRSAASSRSLLHDPAHDPLPEVDALHRRLPRGRRRRGRARRRHRRRRLRRPPGARRRRLEDAARQPRPHRRPRRRAAASSPWPAPAHRHHGRDRRGGPSGCSPARTSASASTPATCSSAAPTRSRSPRDQPDRVAHVHLKDVDAAWPPRSSPGELTFADAVADGHVAGRSARATSTSRRWSRRSRPPATTAGTSWSRT